MMSATDGLRHVLVAGLVAAATPVAAPAQNAPAPAVPAPPGPVISSGGDVRTIRDAIAALRKSGSGKSAPARVLGDVGAFFGPDAYPAEAIRSGEEGRSVVRVELDARGFPVACSVLASSGSVALDEATCRIAKTRLQYAPARDMQGRPMASQYTLPVRWILPHAPEPERTFDLTDGRKALMDVTIEVALDADGKVASCRVVEQLPDKVDLCAGYPVGKASALHVTRNGGASASVMTVITRVYLDQP